MSGGGSSARRVGAGRLCHHPVTVLSRQALNRATLARQSLLERSDRPVAEMVEQLVALQAQTPHTAYVGLWTRLRAFRADQLADLIADRSVVRLALCARRSTRHGARCLADPTARPAGPGPRAPGSVRPAAEGST